MPRPPGARPGARSAACAILERVEAGRGHSNALLAALPEGMKERDRALATELVYGVLRRRTVLDRVLERASKRPLHTLDPPVLSCLRVAVYQIHYLTRIPESAAVDEAVGLIRARSGRAAAAFGNAVLRAVCGVTRSGRPHAPERPDPRSHPEEYGVYLAETHSFPRYLVDRFVARYGPAETEVLLETMNRPAPIALRLRRAVGSREEAARRLEREGIETVPSARLDTALRVVRGAAQHSPSFERGECYIQDEASQLVARLLEPIEPDDRLLDLCAAPGGKLLALMEDRPPGARPALAADRSRSRLVRLRENARRSAVSGIHYVVMDAARPALRTRFQRVLLDAPCSGTGIIRRHPEIRWRRTEEDIRRFARLQATALAQACDLLAPVGRLVYAVCSLEPEEGPERIASLLAARPEMALIDVRELLPPGNEALVNRRGFLVTLPHRDDLDGFFAAALVRRAGK